MERCGACWRDVDARPARPGGMSDLCDRRSGVRVRGAGAQRRAAPGAGYLQTWSASGAALSSAGLRNA